MGESVCGKNGEGKGKGDLEELKPTIMAGVPAVWERIRKGVIQELDKQHWTIRKAFECKQFLNSKMANNNRLLCFLYLSCG